MKKMLMHKSLRTQIAIVFGSLTALLAVVLCLAGGEVLKLRMHQQAAAMLSIMANNAAMLLHEDIAQQSRRAQVLSRSKELWENGLGASSVRTMLDRVQHIAPHNVWIGVADAHGTVRNATSGMLQGSNVSQRPWFQQGLNSVYISDVHPAKLLAELLPPTANGEPVRLVDFSAPIYRPDGEVAGVLAIHANWEWVHDSIERLLRGTGHALQQSVFIFDKKGELIYAPSGALAPYAALGQDFPLDAQALRDIAAGKPVQAHWKDSSEPFLTTAVQMPTAGSDLGWWIVARQPIETAYADANRILPLALAIGLLVGFVTSIAAWYLARRLCEDLKSLAQAAQRLQEGMSQTPLPITGHNREVLQLSRSLSHMTQQLLQANDEMKEQVRQRTQDLEHANSELQRQASTDPLTQLLNRRGFEPQALTAFALAVRSGRPLSVLSLDIDFFKRINDGYGHDIGDHVLQVLARTLQQRMRQTDLVARFGGEEFLVLLPDTDAPSAMQLAEALRQHVAALDIHPVGHIHISIGISSLRSHTSDSLHEAIKRSDEALYQAKQTGRDRVCHMA